MARAACNFRQRDLTAAVKAMEAAGRRVDRVEIDPRSGKLIVIADRGEPRPAKQDDEPEGNDWDD